MARHRGVRPAILLVCALLLALPLPAAAQDGSGVGVTPATTEMDDPPLLRGGSKVATLQFQQHDHDLAYVEVRVQPPPPGDHGDASTWITLRPADGQDPAQDLQVERTSDYPVQVDVQVPETAANGAYAARVNFRLKQACDADGGACVGVQSATSAMIHMDVRDEGEVKRILVPGSARVHHMETGKPFQFTVPLENAGNVDANPHIKLEILDKHQEEILAERWLRDTVLRPGERLETSFIVDDLELQEDQYWARVFVYLDDEQMHESDLRTFDVVPTGTLAQTAELRTIRIDDDITTAEVGDLVRLVAVVENTGSVPVQAAFKGSVLVDDKLVDTLESSLVEIPIGETQGLEMFYRLDRPGQHVFEGSAHYGAKLTEERTLLLRVMDAGGFTVPAWGWVALGAVVPLALVGLFLLGRRGRTRVQAPARGRRQAIAGRPRGGGTAVRKLPVKTRPGNPGKRAVSGSHAGPRRTPAPRQGR